jgi:hypothetical protein
MIGQEFSRLRCIHDQVGANPVKDLIHVPEYLVNGGAEPFVQIAVQQKVGEEGHEDYGNKRQTQEGRNELGLKFGTELPAPAFEIEFK